MTDVRHKDVVDLLLEQHDQIKDLFSRLRTAQGKQKQQLFDELVRLLAVHESAEESVVHPAARKAVDNGDQMVGRRLREEDEAKHALAELYDMGVDHPQFEQKLALLAQSVIAHATREEDEEFRYLRD